MDTGWIGGDEYPYLLKTTNGGVSYIPANIDTVAVQDIFFLNSNTGWVACKQGMIRKTTNGGSNWINANVPVVEDINSVFFKDQWNGIAVGKYGGIYRTRDGGISWIGDKLPAGESYGVYMTATNRAFIVGENGTVLKYEETVTGTELTFANEVPEGYYLEQNYPNPFNPTTTIKFGLPTVSRVSLKIYDVTGREAAVLINNERMNAGIIAKNFTAYGLASGVYFYSLVVNGNILSTKKMMLIK